MKNLLTTVLVLIILSSLSCSGKIQKISIEKADKFPLWLKDGESHTDQTSGIVYLGKTSDGSKTFLLADDIGKLNYLEIDKNSAIRLTDINYSDEVNQFLKQFPKKDFEDLTYDKHTGDVYLSIEGNGKTFREYVGIYKLIFRNNDLHSRELISIKKVQITPEDQFLKYTEKNIGYEGLAVDQKYLYLGLEAGNEIPILSENSYIFIVDKKTYRIIKQIDTKNLAIRSICGLYAVDDNKLIGIDRNSKKIFYINFDDSLNIKHSAETPVHTNIPLYPDLDYIASLESITMDDDKNIYIIDDPWKSQFIPSESVLEKVDLNTVENFKKYIPVIFKYKFYVNN